MINPYPANVEKKVS